MRASKSKKAFDERSRPARSQLEANQRGSNCSVQFASFTPSCFFLCKAEEVNYIPYLRLLYLRDFFILVPLDVLQTNFSLNDSTLLLFHRFRGGVGVRGTP